MIYVTHDQIEAMTMADKIVVLNNARIEQAGAPLDLYHKPANLFVAGFIGSPRMNLIRCRVVGPWSSFSRCRNTDCDTRVPSSVSRTTWGETARWRVSEMPRSPVTCSV